MNKEQKNSQIETLEQFRELWEKIASFDTENDIINKVENYPFKSCFYELNVSVNDWVTSFIDVLEKEPFNE